MITDETRRDRELQVPPRLADQCLTAHQSRCWFSRRWGLSTPSRRGSLARRRGLRLMSPLVIYWLHVTASFAMRFVPARIAYRLVGWGTPLFLLVFVLCYVNLCSYNIL